MYNDRRTRPSNDRWEGGRRGRREVSRRVKIEGGRRSEGRSTAGKEETAGGGGGPVLPPGRRLGSTGEGDGRATGKGKTAPPIKRPTLGRRRRTGCGPAAHFRHRMYTIGEGKGERGGRALAPLAAGRRGAAFRTRPALKRSRQIQNLRSQTSGPSSGSTDLIRSHQICRLDPLARVAARVKEVRLGRAGRRLHVVLPAAVFEF